MKPNAAGKMSDTLEVLGAGSSNDAMHVIALFEQPIGEVAAVLTGDSSDKRAWHANVSFLPEADLSWRKQHRQKPLRKAASHRGRFSLPGECRQSTGRGEQALLMVLFRYVA